MKKRKLFDLKLDVLKAQETFDEQLKLEESVKHDQNVPDAKTTLLLGQEKQSGGSRSAHDNQSHVELSKIDDNLYISSKYQILWSNLS